MVQQSVCKGVCCCFISFYTTCTQKAKGWCCSAPQKLSIDGTELYGDSFWHERFMRSTGTTIVDRYFHYPFLLPLHPLAPSQPFLIEGVHGSKNLFSKSWRVHSFPDPLAAILAFAGGAALQAVWLCRRWVSTPFATRLVLLSIKPLEMSLKCRTARIEDPHTKIRNK